MSEIPSLEQMLKLWSKKDLWNRIQEKNQRIAELEKQLANSIRPKFKRGQEVYTYNKYQGCIYKLQLISIHIEQYETPEFDTLVYRARRLKDGFIGGYLEEELFATEEEAQAKLEELRGNDVKDN